MESVSREVLKKYLLDGFIGHLSGLGSEMIRNKNSFISMEVSKEYELMSLNIAELNENIRTINGLIRDLSILKESGNGFN